MNKSVYGIGLNDADYPVQPIINGERVRCPYYVRWYSMLKRCYDPKEHARQPTYADCSVCEEWLTFSNFKRWMQKQDWENKQLDKDLLIVGNKIYSPDTCVFVDGMTNKFMNERAASRGSNPIGSSFHKRRGRSQANCKNPFTKKKEYLGLFNCPNQAHLAWKRRKHELACQLADLQTDERVAKALRSRYI